MYKAQLTQMQFTTVRALQDSRVLLADSAHVREEMHLRKLPVLFDKEQMLQNNVNVNVQLASGKPACIHFVLSVVYSRSLSN